MWHPGELALATAGVLFLDEVTEIKRATLEAIAGACRERRTSHRRGDETIHGPCAPWIIAAAAPCPCGRTGDPKGTCTCTAAQRARWDTLIEGTARTLGDPLRLSLPRVAPGAYPVRRLPMTATVRAMVALRGAP